MNGIRIEFITDKGLDGMYECSDSKCTECKDVRGRTDVSDKCYWCYKAFKKLAKDGGTIQEHLVIGMIQEKKADVGKCAAGGTIQEHLVMSMMQDKKVEVGKTAKKSVKLEPRIAFC